MEKKRSITKTLVWLAVLMMLSACSSPRELIFADREWHIRSYYGQIIDKDTTGLTELGEDCKGIPMAMLCRCKEEFQQC